jgi:hypothetical protein
MENLPAEDLRQLSSILRTMDIPQERRTDLRWLQSNLVFRNGDHERLADALSLIRRLIRNNDKT